jgi:hypothetical protein
MVEGRDLTHREIVANFNGIPLNNKCPVRSQSVNLLGPYYIDRTHFSKNSYFAIQEHYVGHCPLSEINLIYTTFRELNLITENSRE